MTSKPVLVLRGNQYVCRLYRSAKATQPIWRCGNTGMGLDVVAVLRRLGHRVLVDIQEVPDAENE